MAVSLQSTAVQAAPAFPQFKRRSGLSTKRSCELCGAAGAARQVFNLKRCEHTQTSNTVSSVKLKLATTFWAQPSWLGPGSLCFPQAKENNAPCDVITLLMRANLPILANNRDNRLGLTRAKVLGWQAPQRLASNWRNCTVTRLWTTPLADGPLIAERCHPSSACSLSNSSHWSGLH